MKVRLDRAGDGPVEWRGTLELHDDDIDNTDLRAVSEVVARGQVVAMSPGTSSDAVRSRSAESMGRSELTR